MRQIPTRPGIAALVLAATLASGCGYRSGGSGGDSPAPPTTSTTSTTNSGGETRGYQWRSLYRQDVRTVAVPIFRSTSFERGTEFNLSKALVSQIEASTPYKVVPRERADTILEGEIVETDVNSLSSDRGAAIPQEQMMVVTINFIWKDLRTGRILVERRNFEQTATYYPTLGEGRFVGRQQAVEKLALAIVQELQADW